MNDKSKVLAICLSILAIVIVIISSLSKKTEKYKSDIRIVTNYSNFYTVNSCLYRAVTYISSKDSKNILLILDDKYKKQNNITSDNVLNYFNYIGENSNFVSRKMYFEKISDNIIKYYVYGYIEDNSILDYDLVQKNDKVYKYFIVYIDSSKKTFALEPYDGKIFEGD